MTIKINNQESKHVFEGEPKRSHVELFEKLAAMPDSSKPIDDAFLILCTPRSGSTLFAEALNSCGLLGICEEWFNYEYFSAWCKVLGCSSFDLQEYVSWVSRKSSRDTGVFCLKWHIGQLVAMNEDFRLGIEAMDFRHVVYIYRRDKIAQSVSLVKAVSTNQFRSYEQASGKLRINRYAITSALENIVKFDTFTQNYLSRYIDASYAYEDFQWLDSLDQKAHEPYRNVLAAMGKSPSPTTVFTVDKLKRQADHESERAIRDYRAYILGEIE